MLFRVEMRDERAGAPDEFTAKQLSGFENFLRSDSRIGIEPVNDRNTGVELLLENLFRCQTIERHDQCAERIAVGCNQNGFAAQHVWLHRVQIVRPNARAGILQAFAARRRTS